MNLPIVLKTAELADFDGNFLKIVDLRGKEEFSKGHLPGAVHLDARLINRNDKPAVGLLPDNNGIQTIVEAIGLQQNDHIVAYDNGAETSAARLIWVLHAYGFFATSWLEGGFQLWEAQKRTISTESQNVEPVTVKLEFEGSNFITATELNARLNDESIVPLDVRTLGEYEGTDVRAERGGHVPGAQHYNWTDLLAEDNSLKPLDDIEHLLKSLNVTKDKEVVVYCQSHQRSSVTYVVLKHLGYDKVVAIDGAWSVWGNNPDLPIGTV